MQIKSIDDLKSYDALGFLVSDRTYTVATNMTNMHYHTHYELLYIYENNRTLKIGDNSYTLNSNNIALIPPFIPHLTISNSGNGDIPVTEKRILVNFRPMFFNGIESALGLDLKACFSATVPTLDISPIKERFSALLELLKNDYATIKANDTIANFARLHLCELLLLLSTTGEEPEARDDIQNIMLYIEQKYAEPITLDLLAQRFFLNKYTISRKFNRVSGMSVPRYLSAIRVVHSMQFIREGKNISDVAGACGFNSLSDFERVFKGEIGMTPLQYRKSLKRGAQ